MADRVALVSMHTSPIASAGSGDAGGMNVLLASVATEIAARGVEVDLLTRAVDEPRVTQLSDGVVLHELAAGASGPIAKNDLVSVTDEFGEGVAGLARSGRYDVIHAHYWLSGLATLPVALELGIPLVQSFHTLAALKNRTLAPGDRPETEQRVRSEMFLANQATAIVAGSAAEATTLLDDVRAPADRVWVVPPGVDVDFFTPARSRADAALRTRLDIAPDRPIVAVVGRIQPLKDQGLAIRILAELHALRGWAPVLVIAGDATPGEAGYLESLRSIALSLGIAGDVKFAGAQDREQVADLLAVAAVTLISSQSETFGLVALESAASGTPVVGFRGSGLLESVAEGRSGVLVDSRDPREWALAVTGVLENAVGQSRMSESARQHAEGYTWAAMATALLGVYAALTPATR